MRASFERAELARLLGPVSRVVESRNTIPILSNLLFSVQTGDAPGFGGSVSVRGTDLDVSITATGVGTVDEAGAVTVDAKRFEDIVKKLPAGATINVALEGDQLIIKSGRSRFRLPTLPVSDYPDISVGKFDATFEVDLATLFAPVAFAISREETRYYLNGIFLHQIGAELLAVATDGHRLAKHVMAAPDGCASMPNVIVPTKTVSLVPTGKIELSVSATKVRFSTDTLVVTSKVVDGTFPDYQRVIPAGNDKVARADREPLVGAVDRVSLMATGRGVKLSFAAGGVVLSARGEDGDASDEVAVEFDAEPLEIGFNSGYLRDVLAAFTGDQIEVRMNDAGSPGLITDGGALQCVLMPLRVQ